MPAKIINPRQFITDPSKSLELLFIKVYPHVEASGQPDFSFDNESTMCQ